MSQRDVASARGTVMQERRSREEIRQVISLVPL